MSRTALALAAMALLSGVIFPAIASSSVSAAQSSDWQAGRIIDDTVFTNSSSMSVAQIQDFLNQKVGTGGYGKTAGQCDTNGAATSEYGGGTRAQYGASRNNPAPFTCLKDYYEVPKTTPGPDVPASNYGGAPIPSGAVSAAQLIWDASRKYDISPKVLLVTIQKESAGPLTTDDWPFKTQYTYAMGAHCPDSGPNNSANCDANYSGFSIQISESASLLRYYLDNMGQSWWQYKKPGINSIQYSPNSSCGNSNINILSKATAALYTYTPYQPDAAAINNLYGIGDTCSAYGNRNFWRTYIDWFGTSTGTNIVRTTTNPTYYLLTNSMRFAIPNNDILYAYGLEHTELTYVSDQYLSSITDGGQLGTIFTIPGDGTVYLADTNRRFGIPSGAVCTDWGLACGTLDQKQLGPEIISSMLSGGTLQPLMANQGTIYQMVGGKKLPFFTIKALTDRGFGFASATQINNFTNAIRPVGVCLLENNSFVKFNTNGAIYYYSHNKFYGISTFNVFKSWASPKIKYFFDPISSYNQSPPTTAFNLTTLINFGDGNTYLLDNGSKINVNSLKTDFQPPLDVTELNDVNPLFETKLSATNQSAFRLFDGTIYRISSQNKLPFNSVTDYFLLGFKDNDVVQLASNDFSGYNQGQTLIAQSRLLKDASTGAIYATGPSNTLYGLTSIDQLGQFKFDTTNVPNMDTATSSAYNYTSSLKSLIKLDSNYYVISKGTKLLIPPSLVATYNAASLPSSSFDSQSFAGITLTKNLDRFVQDSSGTIYYVDGGNKRPILNYDTFKQLGGMTTNTYTVPNDFLVTLPTGSPV